MLAAEVALAGGNAMKICVVGAGAMGCLYGGLLADAGQDVTLVDVWAAHVEAVNRDGLRLSGLAGDRRIRLAAATAATAPAGVFDIAFLQTDTNASADGAATIARLLKPGGFALTLQNGIGNAEALTAALGAARVLGGSSYHSAAMSGPGHAVHTNACDTHIGELDGRDGPRAAALAATMTAAGLPTHAVDNVMSVIWTKFVLNCAINPIAAVSGLRSGEFGRNPSAAALQGRLLDEIMTVVEAKGIRLTMEDARGYIPRFTRLKYNRPSMQQHIDAGKRTEIDSLNGALVREADALGIDVPYNRAVVWMVKAREQGAMQAASGVVRDYARLEEEAKAEADAQS
jgi:2-dehydropantoate 2-reductase